MAQLSTRPHPPRDYPLVVVGSGPGGLQLSYALTRLGIRHAVLSADPAPGGMFRRWPFFQRLLSWTKPYAPVERASRAYERYDWNSLIADDDGQRAIVPTLMDGTSNFPSRPEMERALVAFTERTGIAVRYECRWEATRRDGERFVLATSDGEYRTPIAVFAVGMAEPYRPPIPGLETCAHYADTRPAETYADKRVFIVGKENSAFELATGLLQWARRLVLASPSPVKLSVATHTLAGVRARYVQPYEDHALGGGVVLLDAAIQRITRRDGAFVVHTKRSDGSGDLAVEADEVIATTGFVPPLRDLTEIGVATVGRNRIPALTAFWESATAPGIFFAGTITQGAAGLKKHGIPSNSGAVHGHRYNARVLARHLARTRLGIDVPRAALRPESVLDFLIHELNDGPEVFHQRSYLARVVSVDPADGVRDEGLEPLAHFVDSAGPDAVAVTLEGDGTGAIYPAAYVRRRGKIGERLLAPDPMLRYDAPGHRAALGSALAELGIR